MKIRTAIYRGHVRYGFHSDEPAKVMGIRFVRQEDGEWRACLLLRYKNGDEDYTPLKEALDQGYLLPGGDAWCCEHCLHENSGWGRDCEKCESPRPKV